MYSSVPVIHKVGNDYELPQQVKLTRNIERYFATKMIKCKKKHTVKLCEFMKEHPEKRNV